LGLPLIQAGTIPLRGRGGDAPLSFAQQWLWSLNERASPAPTFFNLQGAYRLEGALSIGTLEEALATIVRRHEILRSVIIVRDGHPRQLPRPAGYFVLPVVNLGDLPAPERISQARQQIAEDAWMPFDLANGPLLRGTLFRFGPRDHLLLITMHRIVSDDRSLDLLAHELTEQYTALISRSGARLPILPIHYADFAAWQRDSVNGPSLEAETQYWSKQLAGDIRDIELPKDRARSSRRTDRGALLAFSLDSEITARLEALSRQEDVTLFMTLLAVFQVLLFRHTGERRFFVGTLLENRKRSEIASLIGLFANTLVLKAELSETMTFCELLRKVSETTLSAYEHQGMPFEKLLELVEGNPHFNQTPLFQVMFTLENTPAPPVALPALVLSRWPIETVVARCDLSLTVQSTDKGLAGAFEYNADLFYESTINRILGRWKTLLEDIVGDPRRELSAFALLPAAEKAMLAAWSTGAELECPLAECAHHAFELQVIQTPSCVAVTSLYGTLTYRELNDRANQLANYLRCHGVAPEVLVGLCLESSLEAVVAILAILKAGGVYVPIDPAYPAERIGFILADVKAAIVLTRKTLLNVLREATVPIVCVDVESPAIMAESTESMAGGPTAANLAYVIYTSGSTGKPKGVMIEHNSLVNYIHAAISDYGLGPRDRTLQFASLSFDTSIEEIFPTLSCGATLVLRDGEPVELPSQFWCSCRERNLTVLNLPTAYWHVLVTDVEFSASVLPPSLRLVIIGGERALAPQVARWEREAAKLVKLVNTYGATEATAHVTACWNLDEQMLGGSVVPIGRPIRNVQTHVLDSKLQPVPVGLEGELYIGGAGLARGYMGRPELTAQLFVPDPFASKPTARLYRTGDRVRWRWDGQLEYLGRRDQQVKIHGRRIELGEIETVLGDHPEVRRAAVVVDSEPDGEGQLIAYVVLVQPGSGPNGAQLRAYMSDKLPSYMVPKCFVVLDSLPLTERGKLDRRALLAVDRGVEKQADLVLGPVEEMLARIWRQVLAVKSVGRHDNFFELGGDSIRSVAVVSRAALGGWRITTKHLFQYPTVAGLAAVAVPITDEKTGKRRPVSPPIKAINRDRDLPLSLGQQHIWSLNQDVPGTGFFNIANAFNIFGRLDVAALEKSFAELIRRHEILRTTHPVRDGRPIQMIAPPGPFAIPILDMANLPKKDCENKVQKLAADESRRHFDLSRDRPLRVVLLRLGAEEYVLIWTLHHIAFDDWSCAILTREVTLLYQIFVNNQLPPSAISDIQYADYAAWQTEWLQSPAVDQELWYWLQRLQGGPPRQTLPTDHPRSGPRTFQYGERVFLLEPQLAARLQGFAAQAGTTPFVALLAALNLLLGQILGHEEIWIGTLSANRDDMYTENLIGLFANTLIVRTDLSGDPTFDQLLRKVRSVVLDALDHQALPFERLLDELRRRLDLARTPLFQVLFIMQNVPTPALQLQGLTVEPFVSPKRPGQASLRLSTFDFIVEITPTKEHLDVIWRYNADLFEPDTINGILTHFCSLVTNVLEHPDRRLSSWPRLQILKHKCSQYQPGP
jgi:amino acid adenylation domain-containing protein